MNVDRLVPNQSLKFIPKGITIVYGDNGSGKSGYCRILKQLCRARQERPEQILGDAYSSGTKPPPKARVQYAIDDKEFAPYDWIENRIAPYPACLSRITVFDASAAPLYADKQNAIEFLPSGLDVLPRVGRVLETLAQRLDHEIDTLVSSTTAVPMRVSASTKAGKFLELLCSSSTAPIPTAEDIEVAAPWNEGSERRLADIYKKIGELTEPEKMAKQFRLSDKSINDVITDIETVLSKVDDASLAAASQAITDLRAARETAKIAAEGQFAKDPLGQGVGSDPWRNLFGYAREFSARVYPGESFPVVGPGKYCPLCQQPLSKEASDRLIRFQQFVENKAQQTLENIQTRCTTLTGAFETLALPRSQHLTSQLAPLLSSEDASYKPLADQVVSFYSAIAKRLAELRSFLSEKIPAEAISQCPVSPASSLRRVSLEFQKKAASFEAMKTDSSLFQQLQTEREELEATRTLNQNLALLEGRREKLQQLKLARSCRKSCNTLPISLKNTELREKYLTKEMKERIRNEIASMGLSYLPLKVEARTERGTSMMGVALEKSVNVKTSRILSEGEFRGLALACFLAEVDSIPGQSAIIVDDPVSSLDHLRVGQVARRLVEEAAKRQVIIFTHDLNFFYDLWEAAAEAAVQIENHLLEREDRNICGAVIPNDAPWHAKKVKERLAVLEEMIRTHFKTLRKVIMKQAI
jgi:energy-coupling factor transporter ATP-binding protein EcfA2